MPQKGHTEWKDIVQGSVKFPNSDFDDKVLLKYDGTPTINLLNTVDDFGMRISHVIRKQEWIKSTVMQLQLCKMLEIEPPSFAHLPYIIDSKKQRLQKEPSIDSLINKGFLSEALINGVSILGWNPPHREDPGIISSSINQFMKHEVLTLKDIIGTVSYLKD